MWPGTTRDTWLPNPKSAPVSTVKEREIERVRLHGVALGVWLWARACDLRAASPSGATRDAHSDNEIGNSEIGLQ